MKRKGFILMEVLLALLLLSALAAAVFPILGQTAGAMAFMDRRRRAVNEAVFAADFMIEKIRNNLRGSAAQMSGNVYRYEAYIWMKDGKNKKKKVRAPYSFFVEGEKLKVRLHNGMSEPVTGENTGSTEMTAFLPPEEGSVFQVQPKGLVNVSFRMESRNPKEVYAVKTAILPFTGCSNEQAEGIYGGVAPAPSVGAHSGAGRTFLRSFTGARRESGLWERTVCHIRGGERSKLGARFFKTGTCRK